MWLPVWKSPYPLVPEYPLLYTLSKNYQSSHLCVLPKSTSTLAHSIQNDASAPCFAHRSSAARAKKHDSLLSKAEQEAKTLILKLQVLWLVFSGKVCDTEKVLFNMDSSRLRVQLFTIWYVLLLGTYDYILPMSHVFALALTDSDNRTRILTIHLTPAP